jgi:hypothetical protein
MVIGTNAPQRVEEPITAVDIGTVCIPVSRCVESWNHDRRRAILQSSREWYSHVVFVSATSCSPYSAMDIGRHCQINCDRRCRRQVGLLQLSPLRFIGGEHTTTSARTKLPRTRGHTRSSKRTHHSSTCEVALAADTVLHPV